MLDNFYSDLGKAAVLDVRRSRLFTIDGVRNKDRLRRAMRGQANMLRFMWLEAARNAA